MLPRAWAPGPRNASSPMIVPASMDALMPTFTSSPMITPSFRRPVSISTPEHDLHRGLVESEIRDLRARPQVAPLAEDAVADIVLVGHVGGRHEDRVLHLAGVADFRLRPNRGRRSDVAVGADLRIRADDCRAFDVGAPADGRSLLH